MSLPSAVTFLGLEFDCATGSQSMRVTQWQSVRGGP